MMYNLESSRKGFNMKKLSSISNQIKSNTYSYTGKGNYEAIVNNHKEDIIKWLEDLVPLQKQIENIYDMNGIEIQKRNYTRILTKVLPEPYKEFVCLNILVRDASVIAVYYNDDYNLSNVYKRLVESRHLKYPGKYEKFVDFEYFQKFVMLYREDLIASLDDESETIVKKESMISEDNTEIEQIEDIEEYEEMEKEISVDDEIIIKDEKPLKQETNWTNLLLGKLR